MDSQFLKEKVVFSNSIKNKCITIQISQSAFCFQFHQPIRKHLQFIIIFVILSSLLIHSRSTNVNFISNIYNCAFATVFLSSGKIYCCCIYMHSLKFMEITDFLSSSYQVIFNVTNGFVYGSDFHQEGLTGSSASSTTDCLWKRQRVNM